MTPCHSPASDDDQPGDGTGDRGRRGTCRRGADGTDAGGRVKRRREPTVAIEQVRRWYGSGTETQKRDELVARAVKDADRRLKEWADFPTALA